MTEYTKKTNPEDRLKYLETLEDGWYGFTHKSPVWFYTQEPNVALGIKPNAQVFSVVRSLLSKLPSTFNPGIFPYMDDGGLYLEWQVKSPNISYTLTINNSGTAEFFLMDHTEEPPEVIENEWAVVDTTELAQFLKEATFLEND